MTSNNVGIYIVTHRDSGKSYVGASSNLRSRSYQHFRGLHLGNHHCEEMLVDFNQSACGNSAMEFSVLEYCEVEALAERELKYILDIQPVYNRNGGGGGGLGPVSDERREQMRKSMIGRQIRHVGTFTTPWGAFPSTPSAARAMGDLISQSAVFLACKTPSKVITRIAYKKSRYLMTHWDESVVGKTWGDLGFGFIPNSSNNNQEKGV